VQVRPGGFGGGDRVRILIAGVNYAPEATGIGPYTAGLAEHLAEEGHDVLVSTTFPHYPQWKWQTPVAGWRCTERLNGVEVRRTRVILPRRRRRASSRIAYDTSFAGAALVNCAAMRRLDVVLCVTPPIQTAFAGALLARRWRVPLILLVKDLPLELALAVGMMRPGRGYRLAEWLERRAYSLADLIVVINQRFERSLSAQHVPPAKVVVIPDWVDVERIQLQPPEPCMRELLGSANGEFIVLHSGSMGEKQGLGVAVEAAGIAGSCAPIRLALVGDGPQKAGLERMVRELDIRNVRLLPLQTDSAFPRLLAAADALLLNQRADVLDSVAPSKLLAYMAAGRPVLAAANPESVAARLVTEAECGVVVRPEDPEALAEAMRALSLDAERRRTLGLAGRRFVEQHFERRAVLSQWDSLLADVGRRGAAGGDAESVLQRLPVALKNEIRRLMPRRVGPHRIWRGPLKGRRLVTSWHDYPAAILGYTERSLLRWLQANVKPGQTWIDVGAHYGYTALALGELVGPAGRVFAFEPVLTTAGHLNTTRALNNLQQLTVVPLALAECGRLQPIDVSLIRGMADHVDGVRATATDRVLGVAFDEIWPGLARGRTRIDGIKIDVQGMEIDVVTGMREALLSSRPALVLEIHHGVDRTRLLHLLSTIGYAGGTEVEGRLTTGEVSEYLDDRSYCFLPSSRVAGTVHAACMSPLLPDHG
jgi:colanic acid biosynthesis glycosyl transferase WcaI